jgi:hypothetical protein
MFILHINGLIYMFILHINGLIYMFILHINGLIYMFILHINGLIPLVSFRCLDYITVIFHLHIITTSNKYEILSVYDGYI